MPIKTKADWQPWHDERNRFKSLSSNGFKEDIKALLEHILKLQDAAPKDNAGWVHQSALVVINMLQKRYNMAVRYLNQ